MVNNTIALALSGGGNRGAIHVGVLHAFDVTGIKIDAISGTSAGAIVGALYSSGISAIQLKEIMDSQTIGTMLHFTLKKGGLANMQGLRNVLDTHMKVDKYEDLKQKLFVCASNIDEADSVIFSDGDLFTHICASASVPILFRPVEINNQNYVDGGLFNNLPVDPLLEKYDTIIGVHVNNYKIPDTQNIKRIANQVFSTVIRHNVKHNMKKCDYVINPKLDKAYRSFGKETTQLLFEIGYNAGIEFLIENKFM